jgi:hypothetical protein
LVENAFYTTKLAFNVGGDRARKVLSTAWLFKSACHRVLSRSKELLNALIPSKIAWVKMFYSDARDLIPNKRYAYGAIYLVYGVRVSLGLISSDVKPSTLGFTALGIPFHRDPCHRAPPARGDPSPQLPFHCFLWVIAVGKPPHPGFLPPDTPLLGLHDTPASRGVPQ